MYLTLKCTFCPLGSSKNVFNDKRQSKRKNNEEKKSEKLYLSLKNWRNVGNELAFTGLDDSVYIFTLLFLNIKWSVINYLRFETLSLMLHFRLKDFSVLTAYRGFNNRTNLFKKSKLINGIIRQSVQWIEFRPIIQIMGLLFWKNKNIKTVIN